MTSILKPLSEGGVYSVSVAEDAKVLVAPRWNAADEAKFPEVETNTRINLQALMNAHGDVSPVFVTRPLAILGDVSENGLEYNQAIFDGVYNQITSRAVPARLGHVAPDAKSSDFPPDAGYWIGVTIDSSVFGKPTVFGKCYIAPGDLRKMVLSRQATGTPISNSLYGDVTTANGEPVGVRIETIDFVPEERAALQSLGGDFVVTSEMLAEDDTVSEAVEDTDMSEMHEAALREAIQGLGPDKLCEMMKEAGHGHRLAEFHLKETGCNECTTGSFHEMLSKEMRESIAKAHVSEGATPEETYDMLPSDTRKHVAEAFARESKQKMVPEEAKMLDESKIEEMKAAIAEMQTVIKGYQRQDFDRALSETVSGYFADWQVRSAAGQEKMDALKKNLRVLTVAEMAGSTKIEDIATAAEAAFVSVKPLAEMTLASLAGPAVSSGVVSANGAGANKYGVDPATGRFSDEFVREAVRRSGALGGRSDGGVR